MTLDANLQRLLVNPYWVDDPFAWEAGDAGIAFFAREGRVGMFNLALLIVDSYTPPEAHVYRERPLSWVITQAPGIQIRGLSLEYHAAMLTLPDFCRKVQTSGLFKRSLPLTQLLVGGTNRITNDIRHRRIAR